MSCIDVKARAIFDEVAPAQGFQVSAAEDHPLLEWLTAHLPQLLSMLLTCLPMAKRNAGGLTEALNSPNLRQRAGVRFFMNRNIDDPRTGNVGAREMTNAFYKIGESCTPDDSTKMLAEIGA